MRRNHALPLADLCWKRMADMPTGAHVGTYGDLATLHWVENEPLAPGVLECEVAYGALSYPWLRDRPVVQPALLCLIAHSERQLNIAAPYGSTCRSWGCLCLIQAGAHVVANYYSDATHSDLCRRACLNILTAKRSS